jgi:peptide/nickel transport system ATP-binding protein
MMDTHSALQDGPILRIDHLTIGYRQRNRWLEAVRHLSLEISAGQTCGLVGESGSGKTTLALAIMRYLPEDGKIRHGTIEFAGRDLATLSEAGMRKIWGQRLAMVPQDPLSSLNPTLRIGDQVAEILHRHQHLDAPSARTRVIDLFQQVHLGDPERVARSYPHQISGGMLQRVLIAMALSTEPPLLLMDEPTSSLDVTTEATILDLVRHLIAGRQTSVLYITHNLGVVAQLCDRVAVLYAGELVEDAPTADLYRRPLHPYTQGLLDCVPRLGETKAHVRLRPIEGRIPPLDDLPSGCIFRPRCPLAIEVCQEHPPLYDAGDGRTSRCHRWEEIAAGQVSAHQPAPSASETRATGSAAEKVLSAENVQVFFSEGRSLMGTLTRQRAAPVRAVNGVDLAITRGKTLGLVGESGSGKTTLARAIVGLTERTGGAVKVLETPLPPGLRGRDRNVMRLLQIVFQNPEEALNPYLSVGEALRRPLVRLRSLSHTEADTEVKELLSAVLLPPDYASRLPGQLSGGEKQRVAIARAFAPNPDLLVADEPVSSLDVSVQASILTLLGRLQAEHRSSVLFISHDLAVVGYLADEIAVIYLGQLMETGPSGDVFHPPYHPYTEALLSSVPLIDPGAEQKEIRLEGEIPSPSQQLAGCPFHTRCPRFLGDICVEQVPPWRVDEKTTKRIFCHIPLEELRQIQEHAFKLGSSSVSEE